KAKNTQKRKCEEENRKFQSQWEEQLFFVESKGNNCVCLICDAVLAHHRQMSKGIIAHCICNCNTYKNWKKKLQAEQNIFHCVLNQSKRVTLASFKVSYELAKDRKQYTDREMVQDCILLVCTTIFSDKGKEMEAELDTVTATVCRRVSTIALKIEEILQNKLESAKFIGLAIDENMDINDIPQLVIFIRVVMCNLEVFEDILDMVSLHDGTQDEDSMCAVLQAMAKFKISAVTSDGAPAVIGTMNRAVSLLKGDILSYHCIIHQQCQSMSSGMPEVISVVNVTRARARKHQQFQTLCEKFETHFGDLVLYTDIRWLSHGRTRTHFVDLLESICQFIIGSGEVTHFPYLDDTRWTQNVAFLTGATQLLDELNLKLQGWNESVYEMCANLKAFSAELKLLLTAVPVPCDSIYFPQCKAFYQEIRVQDQTSVLLELTENSSSRFQESEK
uniref:DUF4371 domain-containing protein n=1 Tax=Latimeria chalumnae TaxID=7897 RepID=H3A711_LATCH